MFRVPEVTPLVVLDEEKQFYLLELFHGGGFDLMKEVWRANDGARSYFCVSRCRISMKV